MKKNIYIDELLKFIGKDVIVKTTTNEQYHGICKAICYNHLNIVLMTEEEKILIKNPSIIKRFRDGKKEDEKIENSKNKLDRY